MSKITKGYVLYSLIFCLATIAFALLYHFHVIKNFNLLHAVVYVSYFAGIALMFNCAYCKKHLHIFSAWLNAIFGCLFVIGSIVLLVIGLTNGMIQF